MRLLKQSTATTHRFGPFVDSTDAVTAETGLSIAQADIQISKNGAAFAQTSDASPTTTHDADGWYPVPLTTTDTGTLGPLTVQVGMSGALPVWEHFTVVPAAVYDSLVTGNASPVLVSTTIATLATQQSFTLTAGSTDDDAYNGMAIVITDASTAVQKAVGRVNDYTGSTKTVTLDEAPAWTIATTDHVAIMAGVKRIDTVDTATSTDALSEAQVNAQCDLAISDAALATDAGVTADIAAIDLTTQMQTAIDSRYLQYLFHTAYNVVTQPGDGDALLNKIVENDSTVPRFTTNVLENGPTGASTPLLLNNTTIATLASQTSFTLTAGSADDDAYNDRTIVITDASTATQKAIGRISDYTGSTKTVTLEADPGIYTMAVSDGVAILATSGVTKAEMNAEVDTAITDAGIDAVVSYLSAGTAQAGANGTITLEATEPATADWYNDKRIVLTGGTGAKQSRLITDYTTGRVASVSSDWVTNPDNTTTYEIQAPEIVETLKANGRSVALTITDTEGSPNDLENATVRLTASGFDASLLTDVNGLATFYVDDATYTYAVSKNNYAGGGGTIVVTGNVTQTIAIAANGTPAAADPDKCNMSVTSFDEDGAAEGSVSLTVTLVKMPSGSGAVGDKTPRTETTHATTGLVTFTNLWQGGVYEIYRGSAPSSPTFGTAASTANQFTVPLTTTGEIENFAGTD